MTFKNPFDFCMERMSWEQVLSHDKTISVFQDELITHISFEIANSKKPKTVSIPKECHHLAIPKEAKTRLKKEEPLSKFELFTAIQFKGNYRHAISFIEHNFYKRKLPYIRVGTDYFKVIYKKDRYGHIRQTLKPWNKDTISTDHGGAAISHIPVFDDFIIEPSNTNYKEHIDGFYNMYAPFSHTPFDGEVTDNDVSYSLLLVKHLFGDQFMLGLQYLKLLYERPKQHLPVLCIVSEERETGKTTFINWINMIFGDNYVSVKPDEIDDKFNEIYANKNIISIEEAIITPNMGEKIKTFATSKTIVVNQKFISKCILPFFAKIIILTNKSKSFMQIDTDEIRYWVIEAPHIQNKNTKLEEFLSSEIPKFLTYLKTKVAMPDLSRSRMVFTKDQIKTDFLTEVVEESKSTLYKEIRYNLSEYFELNELLNEINATASDIKDRFFKDNASITPHTITKCLQGEFNIKPEKNGRYSSFGENQATSVGRHYTFSREIFLTD